MDLRKVASIFVKNDGHRHTFGKLEFFWCSMFKMVYFPFEYFSNFLKIAFPPQVKFCRYVSVSSISTLAIISNSMSVFHFPTAVEFFFWLAVIFYWIFAKYPCSYIDKHLSTVSSKIFWDLHYKIIFRIYWIGLGQTLFLQTFLLKDYQPDLQKSYRSTQKPYTIN